MPPYINLTNILRTFGTFFGFGTPEKRPRFKQDKNIIIENQYKKKERSRSVARLRLLWRGENEKIYLRYL